MSESAVHTRSGKPLDPQEVEKIIQVGVNALEVAEFALMHILEFVKSLREGAQEQKQPKAVEEFISVRARLRVDERRR